MAVLAQAQVTVSRIVDISSVTRYYLLQSSTASSPSKPTANPPGGNWVTTEPAYTSGSTNTLYFVDLTVFTNSTFSYSSVSKSSSYEAAKAAYNKAVNAEDTANTAQESANAAGEVANGLVGDFEGLGETIITLEGQVSQTNEAWTVAYSKVEEHISETDSKLDNVQNKVDVYTTWFNMDNDGFTIVKTENGAELSLKMKLDNDSLDFMDGNTVVAYISNEKLMINSAEIKGVLDVGGFRWSKRDNGNMGLMWIGG